MNPLIPRGFKRGMWGILCLIAGLWPFVVGGADVGLAGLFPGKVLLTIDGGAPRTVAVGATTREGVRVLGVEGDTATLEIDGKKRVLRVGQNVAEKASGPDSAKAVLTADAQGHFVTTGTVNGTPIRFLLDTGATLVGIGMSDARRIGIDPSKGTKGIIQTANGQVAVSRVRLDTVKIGDVVLNGVDAMILPHEQSPALLGMSFLNHMEMQRNAGTLTLIKRY